MNSSIDYDKCRDYLQYLHEYLATEIHLCSFNKITLTAAKMRSHQNQVG